MDAIKKRVTLVKCSSYDAQQVQQALDQLLELMGGLEWVKPGMRIAVKPNLLMKKHPDAACTTHPQLLTALVLRLKEHGAEIIVGDSPGGPFAEKLLRSVYQECMMTGVQEAGAYLNWDTAAESDYFEAGKVLKHVDIVRFVKQADAVISVAKLKTHGMMGYTGAVKNLFGVIPGTLKAEYHYRMPNTETFAAMLVDLAEYVSPRLSIIDAVVGMEGDGPSHGTPRFVGGLIGADSPHAADLVGSALMGLQPQEVPTLKEAIERGLCPSTPLELEMEGDRIETLVVPDFKTIPAAKQMSTDFTKNRVWLRPFGKVVKKVLEQRPELNVALCVGCGECARVCPPKAIHIENRRPQIDRKKCIRCFCCQELCPKAAMQIHRSLLARMVQK